MKIEDINVNSFYVMLKTQGVINKGTIVMCDGFIKNDVYVVAIKDKEFFDNKNPYLSAIVNASTIKPLLKDNSIVKKENDVNVISVKELLEKC